MRRRTTRAGIHRGCRQDQDARKPVLPSGAEAKEAGRRRDLLHQDHPGKGAQKRAPPTENAGTAENHGRDALQRVVLADGRVADADLGGQQDTAKAGKQ